MSSFLGKPSGSSDHNDEAKRAVTPPPPYDHNEKRVAPYGTWESPITFDAINGREEDEVLSVSAPFAPLLCDEKRRVLYMTAGRPTGFITILSYDISSGKVTELLDDTIDVRSRVHEYGGAAMSILPDGRIVFINRAAGDSVHVLDPATKEQRAILKTPNRRYADFHAHPSGKWVVAIEEDHGEDGEAGPAEVVNRLVAIDIESGKVTMICEGADFYSYGRFSPDGEKICWVQWNHPDMSWIGSELHLGDWTVADNGAVSINNSNQVAGEAANVGVTQPRWLGNGDLLWQDDSTGWMQLNRRYSNGDVTKVSLKGLQQVDFANIDHGLGNHTYVPISEDKLVASYWKNSKVNAILVDLAHNTYIELELPFTSIGMIQRVSSTQVVLRGSGNLENNTTYIVDISATSVSMKKVQWVDDSQEPSFDPSWYALDQHISFPRQVGDSLSHDTPIHALFKAPKNPKFAAPKGTKPPLIVYCHGGPTSNVPRGLMLEEQYWTSRGYAMAHVNYHGSSTYGRAYRTSLDTHYGILDADDATSCAVYLAKQGLVDGSRCGIVGGSSGGYCVLQSLTRFPDVWAGGVSQYGVSKVKDLKTQTHKFESHFLDKLCFTESMSEEEQEKIMEERSPLYHAEKIKAPVLLLHGLEDRVVPPNQAVDMEKTLRENGGDVKLILYKGEGHGFAQRQNRQNANEEEEAWWRKTLVRLPKSEKQ